MPGPRSTAECLSGRADDLVVRDVANALRQAPAVAEGVDDLAVALAPEYVLEWGVNIGAGVERALPERVDVFGREVQSDRCAADRRWGEDAHLGELVGEHDGRVAEGELDRHQLAPRQGDAAALLRAERFRVPGGGAVGIGDNEVGRDGGHGFSSRMRRSRVKGTHGQPYIMFIQHVYTSRTRLG